ncbi:histidine phosphatase family protein [Weeksella virosa]|uniref:histidine phosphatase family protein n=1 Tax=Weeksella virosa TaxID=1014 RepID=UPI0025568525|nr:histidine phosphatase family protein [Weeksella virosa]MDK7375923.1 histidine phosphatase family protein [Weeksella virosa]
MEIHFLRHTPVHNPENRCYGKSDISLPDNYLEHFGRIKLDTDYDCVFSSPSERCTKIAEYFGLKYTIDQRITELNFGDWEGKKWIEIPQNEIDPWYEDFVYYPTKNGESLYDLRLRVKEFIRTVKEEKHTKVLVITHAGVIRSAIQLVLDFPMKNFFLVDCQFGKKTIIAYQESGAKLIGINLD